jgi:hypothetical protein
VNEAQPRAARSKRRSRRIVVFVHIPKTAGTTLSHLLRVNEPSGTMRAPNIFKGGGGYVKHPTYDRIVRRVGEERKARLLWGHTPYGIHHHMKPDWDVRYITFLRDPVDRALSHYYHVLKLGREPKRHPVGELDDPIDELPPFDTELAPKLALNSVHYIPDNLQTRMLCGQSEPFGEVTDEMLEQAKENLRKRMTMFGLAERFDESLVLVKRRLGFANILYEDQRVNSERPRGDSIPEELRQAAERGNRYDRELYEYARKLFDEQPELQEPEFQVELAALRQALSGKPVADDVELPAFFSGDVASWRMLLEARVALLERERDFGKVELKLAQSLNETAKRNQQLEGQLGRLETKLDGKNKGAKPKRAKKPARIPKRVARRA